MITSIVFLYLLSSLLIAITAFVYSNILILPGEIFGKLYGKLDVFFKTDERAAEGKPVHPVFKMIMQCEKCVSGQMALWIFMICIFPKYMDACFIYIIPHILFIGLTIFLTLIIKKLYTKYIK